MVELYPHIRDTSRKETKARYVNISSKIHNMEKIGKHKQGLTIAKVPTRVSTNQ